NREAVALGTPVYTTFEGRLGAVDEKLLREGRMHRLSNADEIALEKRTERAGERIRRDPRLLVDRLLATYTRLPGHAQPTQRIGDRPPPAAGGDRRMPRGPRLPAR